MSVVALKRAEKRGRRGVAVAHGMATRGAAQAKAQVGGLATQGQQLARRVDGRIKQYTGRRAAGWIDGVSRRIANHPWASLTLAALALYALFALLV